MGNKVTNSSVTGIFQDFEHLNGKLLLDAIRNNDAKQTQDAIAVAKSEFSKPVSSNVNRAEYDDMVEYLIKYLTKEYDVGDGPFYKKTPIEYCQTLRSKYAEDVIQNNLISLQKHGSTVSHVVSHSVGEITQDRVALAKQRLKELRNAKQP